jgi:hypothetical protein
MKVFHCGQCDQLVFFQNTVCVCCGGTLAYLPDISDMGTLVQLADNRLRMLSPQGRGRLYQLCQNYSEENVCNWAVGDEDPNPYCLTCRLNRIIPNLSEPGAREAWARLEAAKRHLVYSLLCFGLSLRAKIQDPKRGLAFDFLAEPSPRSTLPVTTGYLDGVITINLAKANDAEREARRLSLHEPYRTLLGHFRHEIGHYHRDRLIQGTERIDGFRRLFGDERQDYADAVGRHHQQGARANWEESFVSAYASTHPWEDWAETWAH